jgi:RHS repeat-associated protein
VFLDYSYDAAGNVVSVVDSQGVNIASSYDADNRMVNSTWSGGGVAPAMINLGYDAAGQRTSLQRYSDLAGTQLVASSSYSYDGSGRQILVSTQNAMGTILASLGSSYDGAGQLTQEADSDQTTNYTYDADGQLTSAQSTAEPTESYNYDGNGNRQGPDHATGPDNQVTSDGTYNYAYDHDGNLVLKTAIATGMVTACSYDYRNRLTDVVETNAAGAVLSDSHYTYDVFDRRIAVTVNGQTTYTVYNGNNAWADYSASGQVQTRYLFGDRADEILGRWQHAQGAAWYLTDHLGSVRDLVNAGGQVINRIEYNSFGQVLSETNIANGDRFLYTGREFDAATGLYYYRARYYDPALGRFISQDPLGLNVDINPYRYALNGPTRWTDPMGLEVAVGYSTTTSRGAGGTAAASQTAVNTAENVGAGYNPSTLSDFGAPTWAFSADAQVRGVMLFVTASMLTIFGIVLITVEASNSPNTLVQENLGPLDASAKIQTQTQQRIQGEPCDSGLRVVLRADERFLTQFVLAPDGRQVAIYGQEVSTSKTPGHDATILATARALAASGVYHYLTIQRNWRTATGYVGTSRLIPDIIGVRCDGRVDGFEIKSKGDTQEELEAKLNEGLNSLPPERRGTPTVLPVP